MWHDLIKASTFASMFGNQTLLLSNCLFSSDQYAIRVQGPEYEFEIVWGSQVYFLLRLSYLSPKARFKLEILQGGTSFVGRLCFCSVLCLLSLCARLFICALWSPAGKGLTSWLSFVVSSVNLSFFHWYPGSDVVLDCIDS